MHAGRTLAYVYDSGLPEVDRLATRRRSAPFAATNGLDPTAFPSLLRMENELVGFAARLLDAPDTVVGTVTSGGTESVLLAVQGARDAAAGRRPAHHRACPTPCTRRSTRPRTTSASRPDRCPPAPTSVPTRPRRRRACDDSTVLVVASAPSYAHGVVDPVTELAALAAERGIRCHVDACIGGWVLPYATRLGRDVPPWTFAVDGVTSISVDLHKYAYAPKGTSLLLHRDPALRRPQLFAWAAWPGYTMLNSTLQSTRSGGPVAGAWTVVQAIGDAGYERLAADAFAATDRIVAGIATSSGLGALRVVGSPDSTLVAFTTDDTCDPFTVVDEMQERGWFVQPQLTYRGQPATVHVSVSAATLPHVDGFLAALAESVTAAVAAGPVQVDPGVAAYVAGLDPAGLDDAEFDGLLAAAGLLGDSAERRRRRGGGGGGGLALPSRRAEINALLDLASPALREAVLLAFLDRLSRPVRPA